MFSEVAVPPNPHPAMPASGDLPEQFGPYRIEKQLGKGGMGTVYLALDTRSQRKVALKVCDLVDNPIRLERFKREARAAAALDHPNLCRVFDYDVQDGTPYFTMDYIAGPTLDRHLQDRGSLPLRKAVLLVRKLALAMQVAHDAGVIHRDLKPSNIAMENGEPIVIDFGLAHQTDATSEKRLTKLGTPLGTPSYMAPEQVKGDLRAMGPCTDIYALGIILYELLTGRPPFDGPQMVVMANVLLLAPPPLRLLRADLDPRLEEICLKCLAKKPAERWASMTELAAVLGEWVREAPANDGTATIVPRSATETQFRPASIASVPPPPLPVVEMKTLPPARVPELPPTLPAAALEQPPTLLTSLRRLPPTLLTTLQRLPRSDAMRPQWIGVGVGLLLVVVLGLLVMRSKRGPSDPGQIADNKKTEARKDDDPERSNSPAEKKTESPTPPPEKDDKSLPEKETEPPTPEPKPLPMPPEKKTEPPTPEPKPLPMPPLELAREIANSIGMKLALIPTGTFTMGSPANEKARGTDEDQHEVTITKPFYLGVHEVTQGQYEKIMGKNPSRLFWKKALGDKDKFQDFLDTSNFPVENVSWEDAVEFCKKLSELPAEKRSGRTYRLPTEAEWEYSCRGEAASSKPFHFGSSLSSLQANFNGNYPYGGAALGSYLGRTAEVGSYKANAFGLFDMHGNVWEWCSDWYGQDYYKNSPAKNPKGPAEGSNRVIRGGCWNYIARSCRSADRGRGTPAGRYYNLGFRVAQVPSGGK